jgi:hypothetical protein
VELRALISDLSWTDAVRPSAAERTTHKQDLLARLKPVLTRLRRTWAGAQPTRTSKPTPHDLLAHISHPLRDYYKPALDEPLPESLATIVDRLDERANARG